MKEEIHNEHSFFFFWKYRGVFICNWVVNSFGNLYLAISSQSGSKTTGIFTIMQNLFPNIVIAAK